ncbi:MAG TPA: hypothetical protein VNQ76_20700 [Planctomicrobium sp.]|nr:hypothetical protein [Planctomicrobium sp.]
MMKTPTGKPASPFFFWEQPFCWSGVSSFAARAVIAGFCAGFVMLSSLKGDEPAFATPPEHKTVQLDFGGTSSPAPPETLGDLLRICLLHAMEEEYVDEKHWGKTTERFDGLKVRGLRISKREREVNHGFWQRYQAQLVRPEETLSIDVQQESGPEGTVCFTLLMSLRARCEATFVWWNYGVKGLNGTAVSDATVQIRLVLETNPRFRFSLESPIPTIELSPRITRLELKLKDLDLRRLGVFKGPGVSILGDGSRKAVEELLQRQSGRIKERLQKQLDESGKSR